MDMQLTKDAPPNLSLGRRKQSTFGQVTGAAAVRQVTPNEMGISRRISQKLKSGALLARLKVKARKASATANDEDKSSSKLSPR
jgi:hypothetical protein